MVVKSCTLSLVVEFLLLLYIIVINWKKSEGEAGKGEGERNYYSSFLFLYLSSSNCQRRIWSITFEASSFLSLLLGASGCPTICKTNLRASLIVLLLK